MTPRLCCKGAAMVLTMLWLSSAEAGPIHDAATEGDVERIGALLDAGTDVDEPSIATPLYYASKSGHTDAARLLIERGANVNAVSKWGAPLHIAARNGHRSIVELLLEHGADPNLGGGEYLATPLHFAAQRGNEDIVSLLLKRGADPNIHAVGRRKAPPIHYAAEKGHDDVIALLRAGGARPIPVKPITRDDLVNADLDAGRARAAACTPCHTYVAGDPGERGPSLWNVVGREIASEPDFPYTSALTALEGVWDYEMLNQFIADVRGTAPGTDMYTGDEPDRATRIALIAYLRKMADDPMPLP